MDEASWAALQQRVRLDFGSPPPPTEEEEEPHDHDEVFQEEEEASSVPSVPVVVAANQQGDVRNHSLELLMRDADAEEEEEHETSYLSATHDGRVIADPDVGGLGDECTTFAPVSGTDDYDGTIGSVPPTDSPLFLRHAPLPSPSSARRPPRSNTAAQPRSTNQPDERPSRADSDAQHALDGVPPPPPLPPDGDQDLAENEAMQLHGDASPPQSRRPTGRATRGEGQGSLGVSYGTPPRVPTGILHQHRSGSDSYNTRNLNATTATGTAADGEAGSSRDVPVVSPFKPSKKLYYGSTSTPQHGGTALAAVRADMEHARTKPLSDPFFSGNVSSVDGRRRRVGIGAEKDAVAAAAVRTAKTVMAVSREGAKTTKQQLLQLSGANNTIAPPSGLKGNHGKEGALSSSPAQRTSIVGSVMPFLFSADNYGGDDGSLLPVAAPVAHRGVSPPTASKQEGANDVDDGQYPNPTASRRNMRISAERHSGKSGPFSATPKKDDLTVVHEWPSSDTSCASAVGVRPSGTATPQPPQHRRQVRRNWEEAVLPRRS